MNSSHDDPNTTQDTEGVSTPGWTREPSWTDDVAVPGDWD